jgi:hypothetical protein
VDAAIFFALDTNPPVPAGYSSEAKHKWFEKGVEAGVNALVLSPKWNDTEKTPGKFDFADLDFNAALAKQHGFPVYVNLRVIDTNTRSMPKEFTGLLFDDPRVVSGLERFIRAAAGRFDHQVKWVAIGNEVDPYFRAHGGEVAAYRKLIDSVLPVVREAFPDAQFTVNFTFNGLSALVQDLKPLFDLCEIASFTYYPMNGDFTWRKPETVPGDIAKMLDAAGSRKLFLQEVGYASSDRLQSSQRQQADFVEQIFKAIKAHQDRIIAFHFVWMSDIPLSLVEQFGEYYKLPNSENFKAFLGGLGYFDREGKPKLAWEIMRREGRRLNKTQ